MDPMIATQEIQIEGYTQQNPFTIESRENEHGRLRRIVKPSRGQPCPALLSLIGFPPFTNAVAPVPTEATYPGPKQETGIPNH